MHSLRLLCTGRPAAGLTAATGACPPAVWDSDDLQLHVWLDGGTRSSGVPDPFDLDTISSLRLEMRTDPETQSMLCAAKTETVFTAATLAEFRAGTDQHATFEFSDVDTNFAEGTEKVWISITATLTDGSRYTFTAGWLAVVESGDSDAQGGVISPSGPLIEDHSTDGYILLIDGSDTYKILCIEKTVSSSSPVATIEDHSSDGYILISQSAATYKIPVLLYP